MGGARNHEGFHERLVRMTTGTLAVRAPTVVEVADRQQTDAFIELAWTINSNDPVWVPPLRMAVRDVLDREKHPFHAHADVQLFLAYRDSRPVGRIAAILNRRHNDFHEDRAGFFGLFECENEPVTAGALLESASAWLRARGCDVIRGPMNLSTNDELASPGVLIEGFSTRPSIMMSHNPPFYARLLEENGFERVRDLLAFWFDGATTVPTRGTRGLDRLLSRSGVTIRALDLRRFGEEVDAIKTIYNAAWSRNWGFVPMTDPEFDHLAKEFRPFVDPDLCLIAEAKGEPIGFSLALPDLNQALRYVPDGRLFPFGLFRFLWHRRRVDSLRVLTLGFKPQYQRSGLGPAFYLRTWQTGVAKGYTQGEGSWVLEDNLEMVRPLERMGGRIHRRYTIFERPL